MGNKASTSNSKGLADRALGEAHLDSSSPKVIHPNCVSHDQLKLVRKGKVWYTIRSHDQTHEFLFAIETRRQFAGSTQVIVDDKGSIIVIFQRSMSWKGTGIRTLIYRPMPTFDDQQPSPEVYKESELKKKNAADLPKYYLFARQQSSPASKCDASYALLQVNIVYNDPDFAKFQEPPLYRAAKIDGDNSFLGAVMDGTVSGGATLVGKITTTTAHVANGVDMLAVVALGLSVNQSGKSARGVDSSGVV
jgi:hypothetical protein